MYLLPKSGQVFHIFRSIYSLRGAELAHSETPGRVLQDRKAQDWNMEIRKEMAVGLAFWGEDKFFSNVRESDSDQNKLSQVKVILTPCPCSVVPCKTSS